MCDITKYVLAYKVKRSQLQRLLPDYFHVCRGVLRFTIEIIKDAPWLENHDCFRIELNCPVRHDDRKGWFNFVTWENCWVNPSKSRDIPINTAVRADISVLRSAESTVFTVWSEKGIAPFLTLELDVDGEVDGPPHEDDTDGTYYYTRANGNKPEVCYFKRREIITSPREHLKGKFNWDYAEFESIPSKFKRLSMITGLKVDEVLGSYKVKFHRELNEGSDIEQLF